MSLQTGKALVVGATGKIGGAVCLELARLGFDIGIHYNTSDVRADCLAGKVEGMGQRVVLLKADLAIYDECAKLKKKAYDKLKDIDVFVFCASVFPKMKLGEVKGEAWDNLMAVNIKSAFFLSQSIGLEMKENGINGSIIHFSDIAANHPYGDYIPYCVSKAAVESLVRGLALKLAPQVRVNAIAPYISRREGELAQEEEKYIEKIPLEKPTRPNEIAKLIGLMVSGPLSITGQVINVDGGRTLVW